MPKRGASPRTRARYAASWRANSSQHGSDTTAASIPPLASSARAASAAPSSEPLAISVACRTPEAASATRYPPRATALLPGAARTAAWATAESRITLGPSAWRSASSRHSAASTAQPGRNTSRPGIARRLASCSSGWSIGLEATADSPSSVSSCTTWQPVRAARRSAGRIRSAATVGQAATGMVPPCSASPIASMLMPCSRPSQSRCRPS